MSGKWEPSVQNQTPQPIFGETSSTDHTYDQPTEFTLSQRIVFHAFRVNPWLIYSAVDVVTLLVIIWSN